MGDAFDAYLQDTPSSSQNDAFSAYLPTETGIPVSKPKRSMTQELVRQIGLAGRYGIEGGAALPAMAANALSVPLNYGVHGINQLTGANISEFPEQNQNISNALTRMGFPQPDNATERVVGDMSRGVVGAATGIGAGNALMGAASPVISGVGEVMASNPLLQALGAVTGTGAAGATRESGGGEGAQILAGLGGSIFGGSLISPVFPGAGQSIINRLLNNPENIDRNIANFAGAGTTPTIGQATQSSLAQSIESLLSKFPGSSAIMAGKANQQAAEIGGKLNQISSELSPRATSTTAGRAIVKGISGEGGFIDNFKKTSADLYDKLDEHIADNTQIPVVNTQKILSSLNSDIPGAEEISKLFKNSKIQGIESALSKDVRSDEPNTLENAYLNAFPQSNVFNPGGKSSISIPGTQKDEQLLPYEAVKKLRTLVGKQLESSELVSQVPRSQWKALYGSLSEDLGNAAAQTSPEATRAWDRANTYYKTGMDRIDLLNSIVNKDTPESVYKAAISGTGEGATNLNAVMQSLPTEGKAAVTATLLKKIGKSTPGNQNDTGDNFSVGTLLTNWNRLSPEAKKSLFNRNSYGSDFSQTINDLTATANNIKTGSKVFYNPSGTAGSNALIGLALNSLNNPVSAIGQYVGANKLARYMIDPKNMRALSDYNGISVPDYTRALLLNQLTQNRSQ